MKNLKKSLCLFIFFIISTTTNVSAIIKRADGVRVYDQYVEYDVDGNPVKITVFSDGEIQKVFSGYSFIPLDDEKFIYRNLTGVTLRCLPEGIYKLYITKDVRVEQYPNGVKIIFLKDGIVKTKFPNGDYYTRFPDNTFKKDAANGDVEIFDSHGNLEKYIPNPENKCLI